MNTSGTKALLLVLLPVLTARRVPARACREDRLHSAIEKLATELHVTPSMRGILSDSNPPADGDKSRRTFPCLRPQWMDERGPRYGMDLLSLDLVPGRVCMNGTCADHTECSRVITKDALQMDGREAQRLRQHILRWYAAANATTAWASRDQNLDLVESSHSEEEIGHLTLLKVLARVWRQMEQEFATTLEVASVFMVRRGTQSAPHVDEASDNRFHFSSVLYLSGGGGEEFAGGELHFHASRPEVIAPAVGMMLMFTGGWENIHSVTEVEAGIRLSLNVFFKTVSYREASRIERDDGAEGDLVGACGRPMDDMEPCLAALSSVL